LISPGGQAPKYSATFVMKKSEDGRSVIAIDMLNLATKTTQRLPVKGMEPVDEEEEIVFGGRDINFDGYLDIQLVLRSGGANASVLYWLFNPQTGTYRELGIYPEFHVDTAKKLLSTYVRGGFAGLQYDSKQYAFIDGKLTLMRDEKQEPVGQEGNFRKVVSERRNGVMTVVTNTTERLAKPQD
jgi:hypothetical protein